MKEKIGQTKTIPVSRELLHHQPHALELTRKTPIDPNHIWVSPEPPSYRPVKFQAEILHKKDCYRFL